MKMILIIFWASIHHCLHVSMFSSSLSTKETGWLYLLFLLFLLFFNFLMLNILAKWIFIVLWMDVIALWCCLITILAELVSQNNIDSHIIYCNNFWDNIYKKKYYDRPSLSADLGKPLISLQDLVVFCIFLYTYLQFFILSCRACLSRIKVKEEFLSGQRCSWQSHLLSNDTETKMLTYS